MSFHNFTSKLQACELKNNTHFLCLNSIILKLV